MTNHLEAFRIIYLVCLTSLVTTGTGAVSIDTPATDLTETRNVGEAINEVVLSSDLGHYTWSTEPPDAAFTFDDSNYPMLIITNAETLTDGIYKVIITAHGSDGSTDVRVITFTVGNPITTTSATTSTTFSSSSNQHTPTFEALQEPIKIVEWAAAGTSVLQVTATDDDATSPENKVIYSIAGTDFNIEATTGLVMLAAASLDYTTKPEYELVITATDGGTPQLSASITATVTVQTRPIWSDPSSGATLQVSVNETANNVAIKTLSANDEDGISPLVYVLDSQDPPGTVMFEITGDTVYTKAGVDFDVDADGAVFLYKLTFSVSDGEHSAKNIVKLDVTVTDENDNTPMFDPDTYDESIPEYALQGVSVLNVSACDDDLSSPNNDITYSLSDTSAFVIDGTTGLISVATPSILNFTAEPVHKFNVIAMDGGDPKRSATVTVTVSLWTRPEWKNPAPGQTADKVIAEGPSTSEQIILLEAKDDDDSGTLEYSIVSQEPNTPAMFIVDSASIKPKPGVEFDVDATDATRLYTLKLRVTDGDHTAETDAVIKVSVTDINDSPPVFEPSEYSTNITEDLSAGLSVLNVSAYDDDLSSPNNDITYSLSDTSAFVIDGTTGLISVATPSILKYTAEPAHKFNVIAMDGGDPKRSATVTVTVSLWTRPEWINPAPGQAASKVITEGPSTSEQIILLEAKDDDDSGTLEYSIVSQEPNTPAMFIVDSASIKPKPGVEFDVDATDATRLYTLNLRVTDGDHTAETDAVIKVSVTDINDSPPVFEPSEYSTNITEDLLAESSVLTVTATDADFSDANNVIQYTLLDTSIFVIDSTSGTIYLGSSSTVIYDDAPYDLVILAMDNGAPTKTATVTATISVHTKPEWKNPAPEQSTIKQIAEDATDSTVIMTLVAEDKDISNSPLQYSIVSQVPATPVLFVVVGDTVKPAPDAQFDVDASNAVRSYSLTIRVSDGQYIAAADAVLEISVNDVNDSPPTFEKHQYNVTILENTQIGDTIIHVPASDDDFSSPNNLITYSLQADTDTFAVNMSDGRIILVKAPDRLEYIVTLTAADYGAPPLSGEVNVTIQIDADAVDECVNVVCLNEGTCQSSVNMFQCNCAAGWTGEYCGTNIDDCTESPCENEGSCVDGINMFTCNCTDGWKGNTCTEVCSENKFGRNCEMGCQCDSAKVEASAVDENQLCDVKTGACKCKLTWSGHYCENDVDECVNTTICAAFENKACGNIDGGYKCGCTRGFKEDENNNDECITDTVTTEVTVEDNETKIDVSFRLNATREFNLHITLDYKNVKTEVEERVKEIMPSVLRVIARSLASGSLSVNLSLIVQDEAQAKIDTALKLQEIRDGLTFPLFAETVSTQNFLVEETPLPLKDPSDKSQQDVCEVYNAAFGCSTGEQCGIVNGEPVCEEIPKDNLPLILGLGLGILLPSILLIILIAIYVHMKYRHELERTTEPRWRRRRYRDKEVQRFQRRSDTNGYYSEGPQEPPYLFYTGDKEISTVSYTSSSSDHIPNGYLYDSRTVPMEW